MYLLETTQEIWENADFVLALGKNKNRRYAFYPARSILESVFRIEYFSGLNKEAQDDLTIRELLRINKRLFDLEVSDGLSGDEFRNHYKDIASYGQYPNIEDSKANDDPFPNMRTLIENSRILDGKKWYFQYQGLAELSHSKLLSLMVTNLNEKSEYRRSLMIVIPLCNAALKLVDSHLGRITQAEVVEAIKQAEMIVKKPVS